MITKGLCVTAAMAATDFFYTRWILAVKESLPIEAGTYAALLIMCTAFVTTSYVKDKRMVGFAMVGAFAGTWLAML